MLTEKCFFLEIGVTHANTQNLGLVRSGNDTAVIIGQDHNRSVSQIGLEQPFAGYIKVIAVYQGKKRTHMYILPEHLLFSN